MIIFLGSGVSLASSLPGVNKITSQILQLNTDPKLQKLFELILELDSTYLNYSAPFKDANGKIGFTG